MSDDATPEAETPDSPEHSAEWEMTDGSMSMIRQFRQRVPGGWLVLHVAENGSSSVFLPDPDHSWNPPIKVSRKRNDFFG